MSNKKEEKLKLRQKNCFPVTIVENITAFEASAVDENNYATFTIQETLSEKEFYKMWLYLRNALARTAYIDDKIDTSITPVNVDYMAEIMAKPLSFTMPSKSKNNVQTKLAEQLGKNAQSAYSAIHRLRKAGYLIKTEDNLIVPNPNLEKLRKITKKHLQTLGTFPISYLMNIIVSPEKPLSEDK